MRPLDVFDDVWINLLFPQASLDGQTADIAFEEGVGIICSNRIPVCPTDEKRFIAQIFHSDSFPSFSGTVVKRCDQVIHGGLVPHMGSSGIHKLTLNADFLAVFLEFYAEISRVGRVFLILTNGWGTFVKQVNRGIVSAHK